MIHLLHTKKLRNLKDWFALAHSYSVGTKCNSCGLQKRGNSLLLHHNTSNHFQTLTCSNDGNTQPLDTTFLKRKNDKLHVLQYMMSCSHHIQFIASSSPWCKESMHFITCLGGNTAYSKILSKAKCLCATFTMHKTIRLQCCSLCIGKRRISSKTFWPCSSKWKRGYIAIKPSNVTPLPLSAF